MSSYTEGLLLNATPVVVIAGGWNATVPATVSVRPFAGDTVTVEYRAGPLDPRWTAWDAGPVTDDTTATLNGPVSAVRFTRSGGTGVASYYCVMGNQ